MRSPAQILLDGALSFLSANLEEHGMDPLHSRPMCILDRTSTFERMLQLRRFYFRWMRAMFVSVIGISSFLHAAGDQLERAIAGFLPLDLVPIHVKYGLFYGIVFITLEALIRTWLWRILHREMDFRGLWSGRTTYEFQAVVVDPPYPRLNLKKGHVIKHKFKIKQDCLSITISPYATPEHFVARRSIAFHLDEQQTLHIAYHIDRKSNTALGSETIGYEKLDVVDKKDGRPFRLSGTFHQACLPQQPAFRGSSEFSRMKNPPRTFLQRIGISRGNEMEPPEVDFE